MCAGGSRVGDTWRRAAALEGPECQAQELSRPWRPLGSLSAACHGQRGTIGVAVGGLFGGRVSEVNCDRVDEALCKTQFSLPKFCPLEGTVGSAVAAIGLLWWPPATSHRLFVGRSREIPPKKRLDQL